MRLTISEVVNHENEDHIKAEDFFAQDIDVIFKQRYELEKAIQLEKKLWVCPICRQPVKIRGKKNEADRLKSMHFAHVADKLDCPIKTGKNYSKDQILRMKYNGQKESPRHYKLKNIIAEKISLDSRFSDIKIDTRFKGICKDWRKPDVSAIFNGKKIAFELQLSTTFLSVIVERNIFYQNNESYILWIFDNKRKKEDMRFTEMDIFYPHYHNAFFINESTFETHFKLICRYEKPIIVNGVIKNEWQTAEIDFDELIFGDNFQVYWFDYEAKKLELKKELENLHFADFGNLWVKLKTQDDWENLINKYSDIFRKQSTDINFNELIDLLNCLYSIKFKKVIGYNYTKLIQLLHQYFLKEINKESHFGDLIFKAIGVYGVRDQILKEDKTHKFKAKAISYKNKQFKMSHKYDQLLKNLFPELWKVIG